MAQDIVNGVLKPAYGRVLETKVEAIQYFRSGKDMVLLNPEAKGHMKYCSIRDCDDGDLVKVICGDSQVAFYTVTFDDMGRTI